jgi:hypothetical protein
MEDPGLITATSDWDIGVPVSAVFFLLLNQFSLSANET